MNASVVASIDPIQDRPRDRPRWPPRARWNARPGRGGCGRQPCLPLHPAPPHRSAGLRLGWQRPERRTRRVGEPGARREAASAQRPLSRSSGPSSLLPEAGRRASRGSAEEPSPSRSPPLPDAVAPGAGGSRSPPAPLRVATSPPTKRWHILPFSRIGDRLEGHPARAHRSYALLQRQDLMSRRPRLLPFAFSVGRCRAVGQGGRVAPTKPLPVGAESDTSLSAASPPLLVPVSSPSSTATSRTSAAEATRRCSRSPGPSGSTAPVPRRPDMTPPRRESPKGVLHSGTLWRRVADLHEVRDDSFSTRPR